MLTPVPATDEAFEVGEGPRWDAARNRLLWVDIPAGTVLEGHLDDAGHIDVTARRHVDTTVGAVAFTAGGDLVVAGRTGLITVTADGQHLHGPQLLAAADGRRLNDAATDPDGRLLVGSLNLDGPSTAESLWQVGADGVVVLDDDLTMSNGLGWSADGTRLYSVDTDRRAIYVREYHRDGSVGPRRTHLQLDAGNPDGIAVDAADHLWLAIWGLGEVRRYAPDGTLVELVAVPAPLTSAVGFAGADLRTLVVTTATIELTAEQRRSSPASGRLFTARVDTPGLPVTPVAAGTVPDRAKAGDP